ncbi:hypothetical protein [Dongia sp. agr-C8]
MQTLLTPFDLRSYNRTLDLELAHADARQLLDIGLVRAADGSLRLAEDPSQPVGPGRAQRAGRAVFEALAGFFRWLRSLPLRSPNWHPHFFLRE